MPTDKDFLIAEIRRFKEEHGRIPSCTHMKASEGYPSRDVYYRWFGSWNNAIEEAFPEIKRPKVVNKEYLISELKRFKKEYGRIPTTSDMNSSKGYPSYVTYFNHFESWTDALKEAFGIQKKPPYTKELLIKELLRFKEEKGRIPFCNDMGAYIGYPSKDVYFRKFGSWNNAIEEAFPETVITKEYLIEEFLRFQKENNREPIHSDMKWNKGYPSYKLYVNKFGSWQNAMDTILHKQRIDPDFFKPENMTLRKWYIVGYIIGDGHISEPEPHREPFVAISTTEKDKENLYAMHEYMGIDTEIFIKREKHENWQDSYHIIKRSQRWCDDLALYGIIPKKSLVSYIPKDYLETPEEEAAILRGIFDSDGSIVASSKYQSTNPPYTITYTPSFVISGSKRLCEDFLYLIEKNLSIKGYMYKHVNIWELHITGKQKCPKVYDFLYGHENFYIERKKKRFEMLLDGTFTKENDPYYKSS